MNTAPMYPEYGTAALCMAYQEMTKRVHARVKAIPAQSLKEIASRYGHDEGEPRSRDLCPTDILDDELWAVMAEYLEQPAVWVGNPSPEQQQAAIAKLKEFFHGEQWPLVRRIIREAPRALWWEASLPCSDGELRQRVEDILRTQIPVPGIAGNQMTEKRIKELRGLVEIAVWKLKFPGGIQ